MGGDPRTDSSQLVGEGGETRSTHSSGPDDTDNGGCERDWGFETHSRRTFTRLTHSEASESALGDTLTMDATTDDDHHRRQSNGRWENTFIFTLHD